ncbi:MAG: hypothetical protein H8D23_24210 [Candidatus Brocadiales bacterium]|nr:hypothetical protein [Candidatus Brocadiales bacterium]
MKEKIQQLVFQAIDEVNETLSDDQQIIKSSETIIIGPSGTIDSLGLMILITAIEKNIDDSFGITITLFDEHTNLDGNSPFKNVGILTEYISARLQKESDNHAIN